MIPFRLAIPQADLNDLARRLEQTRWPDRETVDETSQAPLLAKLKARVAGWRDGYDWRPCESTLNGFGQYCTDIGRLSVAFLHILSNEPGATSLVTTQCGRDRSAT